MKTEVKKTDEAKVELFVEVNGDIVKESFENAFREIGEKAKVKGFRQGHVPKDILEKNFSSDVHELVLNKLIPEVYNSAVDKEGIDVINMPDISEVKLDRNTLSFKAVVEVSPQIKVNEYKKIKINYKSIEVSADDLKRYMDALKESRKADSIDDNFAKGLGYPNLSEFEKVVERQIFIQKENLQRQKIENEVISIISKGVEVKLPQSLVNRQLQELLRQAKLDLALKGIPRDKIEEQEKRLTDDLKEEAKKQVEVYLILSEIAKRENIPVDDHMPRRVIEMLFKEADWTFV